MKLINKISGVVGFLGSIKPEKLFLLLSIVFGFASLLLVPVLSVADEGTHYWTSYSTFSKLNYIPDDLKISPQEILKKLENKSYFHDIYVKKVNFENDTLLLPFGSKNISVNNDNSKKIKEDHIKSSLSNITHVPQSIGVLIGRYLYGSVGSMIFFGRLINMAVFIAIIYFVIKYTRKWKLIILCISLFPMVIHQMASLSYDALNFALIASWVVLVLNIAYTNIKVTKKVLLLSFIIAGLLCLTKTINILLLVFSPIILYRKYQDFSDSKINNALMRVKWFVRRKKKYIIGFFALATIILVFFIALTRYETVLKIVIIIINTFLRPEINTQLDPIVFTGIVGNFSWLWYRLPAWIVFINLLLLCVVLLKDNVKFRKKYKYIATIFTGTFLAYIASIFVAMYLLWTRLPYVDGPNAIYIQGVQGRYITPVLILLIPLFSFISGYVDIKLSYKKTQVILSIVTIVTLSTYLFLTYIFYYTTASGIKDAIILR